MLACKNSEVQAFVTLGWWWWWRKAIGDSQMVLNGLVVLGVPGPPPHSRVALSDAWGTMSEIRWLGMCPNGSIITQP